MSARCPPLPAALACCLLPLLLLHSKLASALSPTSPRPAHPTAPHPDPLSPTQPNPAGKLGQSAAIAQVAQPAAQMVERQNWTYVSGRCGVWCGVAWGGVVCCEVGGRAGV